MSFGWTKLILTILSALAQDESRSISDNIRWSIQKKFQRGEAMVDLSRMLGYDKGENGEWVINPKQAEIVRYIFERYVCGVSATAIAKELNAMGKKTVRGSIWRADAMLFILRNEKYVGDCESQKTVTKNFLTHEASINEGDAPTAGKESCRNKAECQQTGCGRKPVPRFSGESEGRKTEQCKQRSPENHGRKVTIGSGFFIGGLAHGKKRIGENRSSRL